MSICIHEIYYFVKGIGNKKINLLAYFFINIYSSATLFPYVMDVFFTLISKILPLYLLLPVGFIASRYLHIEKTVFSSLLLYFFAPALTFVNVSQTKLSLSLILLPFGLLVLSISISSLMYFFAKFIWKDGTERIVAFSAGSGNTGYFGIPVCTALLGSSGGAIAVIYNLGYVLQENLYGAYMMARGRYSAKESFIKVIKLPTLYAFILAVFCSWYAFTPPEFFMQSLEYLKGGFVPVGMLLLGAALSDALSLKSSFDWKLTSFLFACKFFLWPLVIWGIVVLDTMYFHMFDSIVHQVMIIESLVPLAANTVAYAAIFKLHPERAAITVFLSTLFALVALPIGIIFIHP